MKNQIEELKTRYSKVIAKLQKEKETANTNNYHYLDGRITTLKVVIAELDDIIQT